jgi:hypothetical protein
MRSLIRLKIRECVPVRRADVKLILHDLGDLGRREWRHIHLDEIREIVLSRPQILQGLFFSCNIGNVLDSGRLRQQRTLFRHFLDTFFFRECKWTLARIL